MGKSRSHSHHRRFEDFDLAPPHDAASFFFDLRLMLPGMTGHEFHRVRQKIEHRLQRLLRKKDRVRWTDDGFFLSLATSHPARAAAAAERINLDLCELLQRDTVACRPETQKPAPNMRKFSPLGAHHIGR